jgi:predicted nuclease of restriction endonuclease-like RecB superfamily
MEKKEDCIKIILDGPLSLFLHTHKYGLNLASFFPNLIFLKRWEIKANIEIGKSSRKKGVLTLNQHDPLFSHYKSYSSYTPEDFLLFEKLFLEQSTTWKIISDFEDILFDGQNYFFPDYMFIFQEKKVYLELFHLWHKRAFIQRIQNLENQSQHLLIGVSKLLLKDLEIKSLLENNSKFESKLFVFREIPTYSQVIEKLFLF